MAALLKTYLKSSSKLSTSFTKSQLIPKAWNSTSSGGQSGGNNKLLLAAIPIIGGAGYYYYQQQNSVKLSTSSTSLSADERSKSSPLNPAEFTSFKIKEVQNLTHDTRLIRLEIPNNGSLNLPVASCVVTRKPAKEGEKPVIRPYTPTSDDSAVGHFDFIIKKYDTGAFTPYLFTLKEGDSLDVKGPFPKYLYKANTLNEIGMIAGGTGITPMLQVVRKILLDPKDKTKVSLIFANKSENDIILKKEIDSLVKSHPDQIKVHYVLDKKPRGFEGTEGYVTKDLIKKYLPSNEDKDSVIFVCGPPGLMNTVSGAKASPQAQGELKGYLKELGYTAEQVYKF
ncbi:ferredoxin reductase-like protein [Neoconidiobolus thromboides FSU 785]|nr:ferredoxin reductase-like protein [Neoconidiobolus thromboides FSU 785]